MESLKRFGWPAALAIGAAAATGYFLLRANPTEAPARWFNEREVAVRVVAVRRASMPRVIRLDGELAAAREVNIVSPFGGRVREVRFKAGDSVSGGDVVAVIDAGALVSRAAEIEAAFGAARNEVKTSEERAARAEKELEQNREWHRRDLIARRDLDLAQAAAETARAQVELARANLAQQEAMLAQMRGLESLSRLRAPFGGVIARRWVEPGAAVQDSAPVLTLVDPRRLKFTANHPGPYGGEIRAGMTAEVSELETREKKYPGRVVRVEPGAGGSREIVIEIENEREKLRPGVAVQARIELAESKDVLLVPRTAVISLDGKSHVYTMDNGGAVPREVVLEEAGEREVAILQGLTEGEWVIAEKLDSLIPGGRVRAMMAPVPSGNQ
jgi:RND family efflux transporter MFP subunit